MICDVFNGREWENKSLKKIIRTQLQEKITKLSSDVATLTDCEKEEFDYDKSVIMNILERAVWMIKEENKNDINIESAMAELLMGEGEGSDVFMKDVMKVFPSTPPSTPETV
jgi:hypothetical protein